MSSQQLDHFWDFITSNLDGMTTTERIELIEELIEELQISLAANRRLLADDDIYLCNCDPDCDCRV